MKNALTVSQIIILIPLFVLCTNITILSQIENSLLSGLQSSDSKIKFESLDYLKQNRVEDEEIIKLLIKLLSDSDPYINGKAANILGAIGRKAVPLLIESLQDSNSNVRWCSAIALSKMGGNAIDAKSALITALNDENDNVRWCAVKSLGNMQISDDQIINALRAAMNDDDYDVKRAASEILKRIAPEVFRLVPEVSSIIAELDSLTPLLIDEYQVPGVSIAIIKERKIFWLKGYGMSDINKKDSVNNETIFEACSMSKPVFAYITLKLIEDGVIDIDTPLYKYLDESSMMNDPDRELITARMVLSHSSGFPNWRKGEEERDGPLPILFKPGSKFGYSGEGMFYLQRVIEHITGEKLEVIADKMLFNPLGMHNTGFVWTEKIEKKLASGHDNNGNFLTKTTYKHANSAYSLYTTTEDYAKFIVEILDNESRNDYSLSKEFKDEMLNRQIIVNTREPVDRPGRAMGKEVFYGLGWRINSTMKGDIVCHSGANRSGFRCYSQFDYLEGSGLVIMTNGLNGSPLWRRLISEVGDL